jgi:hypothetical protein
MSEIQIICLLFRGSVLLTIDHVAGWHLIRRHMDANCSKRLHVVCLIVKNIHLEYLTGTFSK